MHKMIFLSGMLVFGGSIMATGALQKRAVKDSHTPSLRFLRDVEGALEKTPHKQQYAALPAEEKFAVVRDIVRRGYIHPREGLSELQMLQALRARENSHKKAHI